jgi:hypothetical protein
MKRINISVIPPVLLPSNLLHIGTEYRVSKDVLFIEDELASGYLKAVVSTSSLEVGVDGMNEKTQDREILEKELGEPGPDRIWYVGDAFAAGWSLDEVHDITKIDKWFLVQIEDIVKNLKRPVLRIA